MKLNINVLIGCALCVVLIGVFGGLSRTADSRDDWRPGDVYSQVGGSAYSTASYSAASSADGLSVPAVSMRGGNSMFRHRAVSSYAPAHPAPTSLITSSPYHLGASASNSAASALYTTSSATMKSFGGGNVASGVSMSGGSVRATNDQSSVSNSQLSIANIQSPIAYTQWPISNIQSPIASNYQGIGNTTTNGPRAMRGRLSAPTLGDPWWNWLSDWVGKTGYIGTGKEGGDGSDYYFDYYDLQGAYEDFINNYWNSSLGNPPSFDEWLDWFMSSTGNDGYQMGDDTYHWLPVGDVWPLVVMLLFYAGYVFVRKRKQLKVNA